MMGFKWVIVLAALQTWPPLPRLPHAARKGAHSDPRGVGLRVDSADTRADGTALGQQAEEHRLEAEKKRESRKLPSQAEKRREKRRWFDKILAQRKT